METTSIKKATIFCGWNMVNLQSAHTAVSLSVVCKYVRDSWCPKCKIH